MRSIQHSASGRTVGVHVSDSTHELVAKARVDALFNIGQGDWLFLDLAQSHISALAQRV